MPSNAVKQAKQRVDDEGRMDRIRSGDMGESPGGPGPVCMDWADVARAQTKAVSHVIVSRRSQRGRIERLPDTQGRPRVQ
jgi:hypothetical protein